MASFKKPCYTLIVLARCAPRQKLTTTIALASVRQISISSKSNCKFTNKCNRINYICIMQLQYSFIIPVYNRPNEIQELLESFEALQGDISYEIVIVEDGSSETSKQVVDAFSKRLNISYYFKENSGPGDSRNYGMQKAKGNYFIILDSDCILPKTYLVEVKKSL